MRIAYLDIFCGISGDMTLGALIDAGVDIDELRAQLLLVPMEGWEISAEKVTKRGIAATLAHVGSAHGHHSHHAEAEGHDHHHHHGRPARELLAIIEGSKLPTRVIEKSAGILRRIAQAEATVHNSAPEDVHFHEIGGLDSIIDIVGAVVGFEMLGVERIYASPIPLSHGTVECAHGILPVPPPAVLELVKGVPTRPVDVDGETVTPTGAGLTVALAESFGGFPPMTVETIAYGAGGKDFPNTPNVLRLVIGERSAGAMPGSEGGGGAWDAMVADQVVLIEANLDDMSPELIPAVLEASFAGGAVDAWLTPIYMKKGRPGTQISALCDPAKADTVAQTIIEHSTSFGVRMSTWERRCVPREKRTVQTPYGEISVKLARLGDRTLTASPEFEDCRAAAEKAGVSLKEVYAAAISAAREKG
jgi:pyridinium-3,5-bisthiocarboxylic acid mononucleotide nickel chelatase